MGLPLLTGSETAGFDGGECSARWGLTVIVTKDSCVDRP